MVPDMAWGNNDRDSVVRIEREMQTHGVLI